MTYTTMQEIVDAVCRQQTRVRVAVAAADDRHVLEAVFHAQSEGIADPVLVGDAERITALLTELGLEGRSYELVGTAPEESPAQRAVELIAAGRAEFLMKGRLDTRDLLLPVVNRTNNLHTGRTMSLMAFHQLPGYHKLLVTTDGGMIPHPDLPMKRDIILNAVETLRRMGYEHPKVAVLCGIEKPNPKMPETLDAEALVEMNRQGEIPGCTVVGPISYDLAMSREIAVIKGYACPHVQDFDVLVVPNLAAGNILGKCIAVSAGGSMSGIIVGAKIPVVLTSRGATAQEKFHALALAALAARR